MRVQRAEVLSLQNFGAVCDNHVSHGTVPVNSLTGSLLLFWVHFRIMKAEAYR